MEINSQAVSGPLYFGEIVANCVLNSRVQSKYHLVAYAGPDMLLLHPLSESRVDENRYILSCPESSSSVNMLVGKVWVFDPLRA